MEGCMGSELPYIVMHLKSTYLQEAFNSQTSDETFFGP